MADEMRIEILPDGTIRTETNPISPINHQSAEDFMKQIATLTGGPMVRARRGAKATTTRTTIDQS